MHQERTNRFIAELTQGYTDRHSGFVTDQPSFPDIFREVIAATQRSFHAVFVEGCNLVKMLLVSLLLFTLLMSPHRQKTRMKLLNLTCMVCSPFHKCSMKVLPGLSRHPGQSHRLTAKGRLRCPNSAGHQYLLHQLRWVFL